MMMALAATPDLTKLQYKVTGLITRWFQINESEIHDFEFLATSERSLVFQFRIQEQQQQYCLRWNLTKTKTNWLNEYYYLTAAGLNADYAYFDVETGNYIKKKWPGEPIQLSMMTPELWEQLLQTLAQFQNQELVQKHQFNYTPYNLYLNHNTQLDSEDLELFVQIGELNKTLPVVLAHNSLDLANILYDPATGMRFIDFEWVGLNNPYFDLAHLIFSSELDAQMVPALCAKFNEYSFYKLNVELLWLFVYFAASLGYQWANHYEMLHGPGSMLDYKIKSYRAMQNLKKEHKFQRYLK
ncbi:hypothetical protein J2Z62_000045 [Mycoplasmoides fastidiosum]|uniref:Aminoglycoside phosphotransferase domain-containing protein n=1 Tax=Mycoplasmoides fastidiosum TaxID=92758 RepID=A0ABU0LY15_9BACT|nr:phosphotransferase [Mycoplasmoides fastidiosum]MDQ0513607.1 hypothetical protein [Mycoplasmoides fastidiosum]UUD37970.1 phosphotransferase [Mycoplasmoides fastidiosum]